MKKGRVLEEKKAEERGMEKGEEFQVMKRKAEEGGMGKGER